MLAAATTALSDPALAPGAAARRSRARVPDCDRRDYECPRAGGRGHLGVGIWGRTFWGTPLWPLADAGARITVDRLAVQRSARSIFGVLFRADACDSLVGRPIAVRKVQTKPANTGASWSRVSIVFG